MSFRLPLGRYMLLLTVALLWSVTSMAQSPKVHSHNDYLQNVPFWKAYAAGVDAIEVDIHLQHSILLVGHDTEDLLESRSLERLYLKPIEEALALQLTERPLLLLIDIKTEAVSTLDALQKLLKAYPSLTSSTALQIVISGNRPKASDYARYPDYISFDHQNLDEVLDGEMMAKVAMLSQNFRQYSVWNGKGRLTREDKARVMAVIAKAHALGKPFRFWASPDSKTAWKAMADMDVDFINTDKPTDCVPYVRSLPTRVYSQATKVEVYTPRFTSDGSAEKPRNIILFIGDGNGLAQICAADAVNGGSLTLSQLKHIGL